MPLLLGTDAGAHLVEPGYSVHDELEALSEAGLSAAEALQTATTQPAKYLRLDREWGVIRAGAALTSFSSQAIHWNMSGTRESRSGLRCAGDGWTRRPDGDARRSSGDIRKGQSLLLRWLLTGMVRRPTLTISWSTRRIHVPAHFGPQTLMDRPRKAETCLESRRLRKFSVWICASTNPVTRTI